ncbi:MAG: response regulator [Candidatus Cloacimonetes bacterium]|nr:response regulator [Candidatus Cloacimonadota bacterium]
MNERNRKLVVIVDDEPDILDLVSINLQKSGYHSEKCEDAESLLKLLETRHPDLIILDLMLPDMDGFEICKYLKNHAELAEIPVIMLTARGEETDRILGLEFGADDYVVKPFSPRELMARVKAVLRRHRKTADTEKDVLSFGNLLRINFQKYEVLVENNKIELTSTEFRILQLLTRKPGWVYSRNQILDFLWGNEKIVLDRTVDVHMRNLREKLGNAAGLIKNVRGVGYKLDGKK